VTDVHDPATRSRNMAAVRARDTKPELIIRKALHAAGLRYRLNVRDLPGKPDIVLPRLAALKQMGVCVAIDDFGTGYSSLSQLHEMQADELKIDISFVRRLDQPSGLSLVQAIINMASLFGMKTVAEGVEDNATAEKLRSLGVNCLQGYFFAKPMPRAEFLAWLQAQPGQPDGVCEPRQNRVATLA
jgi:EAL domain-containing protein (putative c-di-GMP-specific phosphodiesterase class I)